MSDVDLKIRISGDPSSGRAALESMAEGASKLRGEWTELNQALEVGRKAWDASFEILKQSAELLEVGGGLHEQRIQFEALAASHGMAADRMVQNIKRISDENATLSESFALGSKLAESGLAEKDQTVILEYSKKWSEAVGKPFLQVAEQAAHALATGRVQSLKEMGLTADGIAAIVDQARRKMSDFADVDFSAADKIGAIGTGFKDFYDRLGEAMGKSPEVQRALTEMADAAVKFTKEFKYDQSIQPVVKFLDTVYEKAKSVAEGMGLIVDGLGQIDKAAGGTGGGGTLAGSLAVGAAGAGGTALLMSGFSRLSQYAASSAAAAEAAKMAAANGAEFAATRALATLPVGASPAMVDAVAAFAAPEAAAGTSLLGGAATGISTAVAALLSSPVILTAMIGAVGYLIYNGSGEKTKAIAEPTVGQIPRDLLEDVTKRLNAPRAVEAADLTKEQQEETEKRFKRFLDDQKTALKNSLEDQEYERRKANDRALDVFKSRIERENQLYKDQTEILKQQQDERLRELEKRQGKQKTDFERFQAYEAEQVKATGRAPTGSVENRLEAFLREDRKKYGGAIKLEDSPEITAEKFRRQQEREKAALDERLGAEKRAFEQSVRNSDALREKNRDSAIKQIEEERDAKKAAFDDQSRRDRKYIENQMLQFDRGSQDAVEAAKKDGFKHLYLPPGMKSSPDGATTLEQLPGQSGGAMVLPAENVLAEILALLRAGVLVSTKGGERITDEITDVIINRASIRARLEGTAVAAAN